jgi:hypothetical protein
VSVSCLNSTYFVISWYDYVDFDLSYAIYDSVGNNIVALTDIESWPTAGNVPFQYQSPCSQEAATGIEIYSDNWIIAYANTTTQAIWKAFQPNGTAWDGTIPATNTAPTNDACDSDATFTANIYGWSNMTVSDVDLVANLQTVDIEVNTTGDAQTFTLRWTQATGVFSEVSDASGICSLGTSVRVNIDADTDRICFNFSISVGGTVGACDVEATTTDDSSATDTDLYASEFTLAFYTSVTVDIATHSWSIIPGQNNITITEGTINITVTANANFNVQVKSWNASLANGANTIALSNLLVHKDTLASASALTTNYANVGGLTNQVAGTGVAITFVLWLTCPVGKPAGSYTYVLALQVTQYT